MSLLYGCGPENHLLKKSTIPGNNEVAVFGKIRIIGAKSSKYSRAILGDSISITIVRKSGKRVVIKSDSTKHESLIIPASIKAEKNIYFRLTPGKYAFVEIQRSNIARSLSRPIHGEFIVNSGTNAQYIGTIEFNITGTQKYPNVIDEYEIALKDLNKHSPKIGKNISKSLVQFERDIK